MLKRATGILRALGVLLVLWSTLALVGWIATDLPPVSPPTQPDRKSEGEASSRPDAGTADAGAATAEAAADAGKPGKAAASTANDATATRYVACDGAVAGATVRALDVVGDPRPELVLGCGTLVHVLAVEARNGALVPVRVATFEAAAATSGGTARAAPPAAGDVDGDGRPDLVLGFSFRQAGSGTRGGALYLVRGNETGAFEAPRRLATLATVDIALAQLDDRKGAEIVALGRGNELARRPGELWVFGGGPSVGRQAKLKTGLGAEALAVGDLDGDEHPDLVAAASGEPRVDAFFGDGTATFSRSTTVSIADAHDVTSGDIDGDGYADVVVSAAGLHRLTSRSGQSLRAEPIDAPSEVGKVHFADLDGEPPEDLLALVGRRVLRFDHTGDALRAVDLLHLPERAIVPREVQVADLDADGDTDLVLLGRRDEGAPWQLALFDGLPTGSTARWPAQAAALDDAPLRLRIALRPEPVQP